MDAETNLRVNELRYNCSGSVWQSTNIFKYLLMPVCKQNFWASRLSVSINGLPKVRRWRSFRMIVSYPYPKMTQTAKVIDVDLQY